MTRRTVGTVLVVLGTVTSLASCGGDDSATVASTPTPPVTIGGPTIVVTETVADIGPPHDPGQTDPTGRVTGDAPPEIVDQLVRRVSDVSGVSTDDVTVDVAVSKVWTDGSLGCAEPGFVSTQQEEAGYHVELSADGQTWSFRVRETGETVTCDE